MRDAVPRDLTASLRLGVPDEKSRNFMNVEEKPRFTNLCTFTKPVYAAYLRGIEPRWKMPVLVFCIAVCVMFIAFGVSVGVRLDIIGAGLLGCVACGLALAQPQMMAYSKTANAQQRYGECQRNVTRFYDERITMENLTAHAEATAAWSEVDRIKETEDFIYFYVGKRCYCAILTGFTCGEEELDAFRAFVTERAQNAKGCLKPMKQKRRDTESCMV